MHMCIRCFPQTFDDWPRRHPVPDGAGGRVGVVGVTRSSADPLKYVR